jgi:hypothetical protein
MRIGVCCEVADLTTGKRKTEAAEITLIRKYVSLIMDLGIEFDKGQFSKDGFIKV